MSPRVDWPARWPVEIRCVKAMNVCESCQSVTAFDEDLSVYPSWITPELVADTRMVWEPRYGHALTTGDVIEILQNVGQLFDVMED